MNWLEFIYAVLVLIVIFFLGIGAIGMKLDTRKLEEENKKLKEDLEKARKKVVKREYRKVKEVK